MNLPGALVAAASGLAAEGTSVMPDSETGWLTGVTAMGTGLLGTLAAGVALRTGFTAGFEVGDVAAGVEGMSYFCSWSR